MKVDKDQKQKKQDTYNLLWIKEDGVFREYNPWADHGPDKYSGVSKKLINTKHCYSDAWNHHSTTTWEGK